MHELQHHHVLRSGRSLYYQTINKCSAHPGNVDKCQVDWTGTGSIKGSEDCLFLNIYTPALPDLGENLLLRPVMLWIHGGGFEIGDATEFTDPEFFLEEGVVFVALQYRLGLLGFLSVENSTELTGNFGLKDQQEAMRWVQQNIAAFGGDPSKVTLFGESAGAISVHQHVLSPTSRGLFRAGILQSGTALMFYERLVERTTEREGERLLQVLGCDKASRPLDCLQGLEVEALLNPEFEADLWTVQDNLSAKPVLPFDPLQQLMSGAFHKVPLIVGVTKDDGAVVEAFRDLLEEVFEAEGKETWSQLALGANLENVTSTERLIVSHYLGRKQSGSFEENLPAIMDLHFDAIYASPAHMVSTLHGKKAPVYSYLLNSRCNDVSTASLFSAMDVTEDLVFHGDDIPCIFKPDGKVFAEQRPSQAKTSRAVVRAWTNFAKHLQPEPSVSWDLTGNRWTPGGRPMLFQVQSAVLTEQEEEMQPYKSRKDRLELWSALYWRQKKREIDAKDGLYGFNR